MTDREAAEVAKRLRLAADTFMVDYGWHHPSDVMVKAAGLIELISAAVGQHRNFPFRSADWLAAELMTIFDTIPANDAHLQEKEPRS